MSSPEWRTFTITTWSYGLLRAGTGEIQSLRNRVGAPIDWLEKAAKSVGGIIFQDVTNTRNNIRVMPGNPASDFPAQRVPYVKYQMNGIFYDKNGYNIFNGDTTPAHIPLSELIFLKYLNFKVYE